MSSPRRSAIEAVEELRSSRVIVVAASWRPDTSHDLGLDAAREFIDVFESMGRPDKLSLFVVARGGHPGFADQLIRTIRGAETRLEVIVPVFCNGIATLLGIYAAGVVLYPHGGLGAYDAGPLGADTSRLDHDLVEYVPAMGGLNVRDSHTPAQLATGVRQRMLAKELARRISTDDETLERLSQYGLGHAMGLGAAALAMAGIDTELVDDPSIWELYLQIEAALQLRSAPRPAYTESDLGDEVEFEPALGLTTALIESTDEVREYVIDTGRPDADTGQFSGAWEHEVRGDDP